ncbi:MAG: T9SS type A sorting domain-containing protein [Dysgonamonadaceae bacterium]|jgi:hypothetical protein|nr:T9SS type A sorting domain-containing protein [Dysgonamonadaceae bacterium]
MKKKLSYFVMMSCFLLSGQVSTGNVYLPTVAYRGAERNLKIEYKYDLQGNMTLEQYSYRDAASGKYLPESIVALEYHLLPNGEYATSKREITMYSKIGSETDIMRYRQTFGFDNNGMRLFEKYEYLNPQATQWTQSWGEEAILDQNGIRTGLKTWNYETGQLEVDPHYSFDNKGRLTKMPYGSDGSGAVSYLHCTWGSKLNELTDIRIDNGTSFTNIVPRINQEYFDAYTLYPMDASKGSIGNGIYAWEDYMLHTVFADMDVTLMGKTGKYACTIDDAKGEWTRTLTLDGQVHSRNTLTRLPNGGWESTEVSANDGNRERKTRIEYNKYGALVHYYDLGTQSDPDGNFVPEEHFYDREYDSSGRPKKTTHRRNGYEEYTETYEDWANVNATVGIREIAQPVASVYPNPATDYIRIGNVEKADIMISDLSGRIVYRQAGVTGGEAIPVASLVKGMYLMTVREGNRTTSNKFIKK